MHKYVAFIDILGFKDKLKGFTQKEAEEFVGGFSSMLYREWESSNNHINENIHGYIISDSIIVYTNDCTDKSLKEILSFIMKIFKKAFSENGVLLRGAISKGAFNQLETCSFKNLQKGLIVGKAYVEAYMMESSKKGSLILLSRNVKDDIGEYYSSEFEIVEIKSSDDTIYSLRWADIDYLLENKTLEDFVKMAQAGGWSPHYYETLHMFFINEKSEKKNEVIGKIYRLLESDYQWADLDKFIQNALSQDINKNFQKIFLKFLRSNIKSRP